MATDKEQIQKLVTRFHGQIDTYKNGSYNETQVGRYAWSAKLPLSILTDFEEFAVYDTHIKPIKTDPERNTLKRLITSTDTQIDKLVYELYDLTKDEIKIVKGKA